MTRIPVSASQAHVAGWVGLFDLAWLGQRTAGGVRAEARRDHLASLVVDHLPDWLTPLLDAEDDARGRPLGDRRSRRAVTRVDGTRRGGGDAGVERLAPDGPVAVVCGKGNNGGDGLVVARLLREAARSVTVVCAAPPGDFAGDARVNLERLPGEAPLELAEDRERSEQALAEATVIVDALLGTGFQGEPRGAVGEAIEAVNAARASVVSVDVPSGVDASTGVASGCRRAGGSHRDLPRRQAGSVDCAGEGACGRG